MAQYFLSHWQLFLIAFLCAAAAAFVISIVSQLGAAKTAGVSTPKLIATRLVYGGIGYATLIGMGLLAYFLVTIFHLDGLAFVLVFIAPFVTAAYTVPLCKKAFERLPPIKMYKEINDRLYEEVMRKQGFVKVK